MDYNPYQNPGFFVPNPPPHTSSSSIDQQDRDHRDRFPQWTQEETKQLLFIRAELDQSFTETKRNKTLWDAIASRMQQLGFLRTPEQCKSKWKNLVTRSKQGSETMDGDQKFMLHEEMRNIFSQRTERLLHFDKGKEKALNEEVDEEEIKGKKIKKRKRKGGDIEESLREFGRKQMEMHMRWMEAAEAIEAERKSKAEEWRREMTALHEQRMEMDRKWREREEKGARGRRPGMSTDMRSSLRSLTRW